MAGVYKALPLTHLLPLRNKVLVPPHFSVRGEPVEPQDCRQRLPLSFCEPGSNGKAGPNSGNSDSPDSTLKTGWNLLLRFSSALEPGEKRIADLAAGKCHAIQQLKDEPFTLAVAAAITPNPKPVDLDVVRPIAWWPRNIDGRTAYTGVFGCGAPRERSWAS